MVEFRKIIGFGKSSFVISLPKAWIEKNKLKKGDVVAVEENLDELRMSPKLKSQEEEIIITEIKIDDKDLPQIRREVISAYLKNSNVIKITGKDLKKYALELKDIMQNLMALEIIEQTSNQIVTKDFLNMEQISIESMIRKLDVILKAIFEDVYSTLNEDNFDNIKQRDEDINRINFLISRTLNKVVKDNDLMKKLKLNHELVYKYFFVTKYLEKMGDHLKWIAKYSSKTKMNKKILIDFKVLTDLVIEFYQKTMRSFFLFDEKLARECAKLKYNLLSQCESLGDKYKQEPYFGNLVMKTMEIIETVQDINRLVYS